MVLHNAHMTFLYSIINKPEFTTNKSLPKLLSATVEDQRDIKYMKYSQRIGSLVLLAIRLRKDTKS